MGVYDGRFLDVIAETLDRLGTRRAAVLHSEDGLDECSISAPTTIVQVHEGEITRTVLAPEDVGLTSASRKSVTAGDLDHATSMIRGIVDGSLGGPPRDMALLNAAVALMTCDRCDSIRDGVALAAESIDSGHAMQTLETLVRCSQG
jgi:anthranilate phosphoribosyltransferase